MQPFEHTDSMDINGIVGALDSQPGLVHKAEVAAAEGKYILSLAKNAYELEYNKAFVSAESGKTVKDKEAYALQQMSERVSENLNAFLVLIDPDRFNGDAIIHIEEALRMIELKSSKLFADYHLEQNKLDVYRQKASLLKELINSKV